jgi:group I intron endonuclease
MLGLDYNRRLGKAHFLILFIGVWLKRRAFLSQKKIKYSSSSSKTSNSPSPNNFIMFFTNIETSKTEIYKSLRNKPGVYMFINNINNETYIGSSINLTKRMTSHFYHAKSGNGKSVINRAMFKHKLTNFSLGILEFCTNDTITCITLEQKWIDHYNPSYNILKIAGSSFGFTHSIRTINKLKERFKKENHPKYGTTTSPKTIEAIKQGLKEFYLKNTHPYKGKTGKLSPQYCIGGFLVFCYNKEKKELIFPSINATRQHFNVR